MFFRTFEGLRSGIVRRSVVSTWLLSLAAGCGSAPGGDLEVALDDDVAAGVQAQAIGSGSPLLKAGLHPCASDMLRDMGVSSSIIMQTLGDADPSAGTHLSDGTANGEAYSAATDISVRNLSTASEIRAFLEDLARHGFAAWYRNPGADGWPASGAKHIHAIFVGVPMKAMLDSQVDDWLNGKTGLVGHDDYGFWQPSAAAKDYVKRLYDNGSSNRCSPGLTLSDARDGMFVRNKASGEVFIIAGGAPLYVADSKYVGSAIVNEVDASFIAGLKNVPRDGTLLSADGEVYVVVGGAPIWVSNWNNIGGSAGKTVINVDPAAVNGAGAGSGRYSHLNDVPVDGTLFQAKPSGEAYVVVGGAPQYITNWDNVGGNPDRAIPIVDDAAVAGAGATSGRLRHLNRYPADGARFQGGKSNEAYIVAGGAPIYITSWDNVGGAPTTALPKVDDAVIEAAGTPSGRYGHLRKLPADGTFVQGAVSHEAYVMAGGAPIYISNWANVGGTPKTPVVAVDDAALNSSGAASGRYSHIAPKPADGTFVVGTSGQVYRVEGGAPIYVSTWSVFTAEEKAQPVTKVDQAALDSANPTDHRYKHLSMLPADGTQLLGSSGKRYTVSAGKPLVYSGPDAFLSTAKVDQYAIDHAGGTGPLAHLLAP